MPGVIIVIVWRFWFGISWFSEWTMPSPSLKHGIFVNINAYIFFYGGKHWICMLWSAPLKWKWLSSFINSFFITFCLSYQIWCPQLIFIGIILICSAFLVMKASSSCYMRMIMIMDMVMMVMMMMMAMHRALISTNCLLDNNIVRIGGFSCTGNCVSFLKLNTTKIKCHFQAVFL